MFVGDQARLEVAFAVARARLASLVHGTWLFTASRKAYDEGITGLRRAGLPGAEPGRSRLAEVQIRDLVQRGDSAVLQLRWHVTGGGGSLFPVLDADITLSPDGQHATVLAMAGAYRLPPGAVAGTDRAVVHRVATATIGSFVHRISDVIAVRAPAREPGPRTAERQTAWLRPAPEEP